MLAELHRVKVARLEHAARLTIAIMDEAGRWNEENNSRMLWLKDWNSIRYALLKALDPSVDEEVIKA